MQQGNSEHSTVTPSPNPDLSRLPSLVAAAASMPLYELLDTELCERWILTHVHKTPLPRCPRCGIAEFSERVRRSFFQGRTIECRSCSFTWNWKKGTPFEDSVFSASQAVALLFALSLNLPAEAVAMWTGKSKRGAQYWRVKVRPPAALKSIVPPAVGEEAEEASATDGRVFPPDVSTLTTPPTLSENCGPLSRPVAALADGPEAPESPEPEPAPCAGPLFSWSAVPPTGCSPFVRPLDRAAGIPAPSPLLLPPPPGVYP